MRIISITLGLPDESDAMWTRIFNIEKILRSNGHDVKFIHYVTTNDEINYTNKNICKTSLFLLPFKIFKMLYKEDFDLIYGNSQAATFSAVLGKLLLRKKLVFDMHGDTFEEFLILTDHESKYKYYINFMIKKIINFVCLKFSDRIVCVSKSMMRYLNKKGIKNENICYVPNVIHLDEFNVNNKQVENKKNELKIKNKFIFGYLGGFQRWQGVENLIKAAKKINNDKTLFLIVGGNNYVKKDNLLMIPQVHRSEIPIYYSICDVLILPRPDNCATEIAAPTKFAEYAAAGKPILVTNIGDAAILVKKYKNGLILKNNEPQNIIKGLLNFMNLDEKEIFQMGVNSRKLAEMEFNINKIKIDF